MFDKVNLRKHRSKHDRLLRCFLYVSNYLLVKDVIIS